MNPVYVYGIVSGDAEVPEAVRGLGPSGEVWRVGYRELAAVVSDVPTDRPLGTRGDLLAHDSVVDAFAAVTSILPMRFPAVVDERGVNDELLAVHYDQFVAALAGLAGRVQFSLKGRYDEEVVLREAVEGDGEIEALRAEVRELPEDASYYQRVRLGELVVGALEARRAVDSAQILQRLEDVVVAAAPHEPAQPEDVVDVAVLVDRGEQETFESVVEDIGKDYIGRIRLRLLGPLAPYDFVAVV